MRRCQACPATLARGPGSGLLERCQVIKVVTLGEILVEVMAQDVGRGFRRPLRLLGPFPSGGAGPSSSTRSPKLGQPCGIVSCVGDDDFGQLNLKTARRRRCRHQVDRGQPGVRDW